MQGAVRFEKFRLPLPKYTANGYCSQSLYEVVRRKTAKSVFLL